MQEGQPRITTSCVEPPTTEYVQLYTPTPSLLYTTTQVHMIISPLSPFSLITLTYQLQQMFINGLIFFKLLIITVQSPPAPPPTSNSLEELMEDSLIGLRRGFQGSMERKKIFF